MSQMKPTKPYQLWTHTGLGYSFVEFNSTAEIMEYLQGGNADSSWFVTRLQDLSLYLLDSPEPKIEP